MASCDDDVLSSSMEMQHATAHIIRAECIRCHLCEYTAAQSLRVKLFCGKQEERRGTEGGRMMVNYIPFTVLLRYSAACVQRGVRINGEMKIGNENGLLSFFFAYLQYSGLHNCGVFSH